MHPVPAYLWLIPVLPLAAAAVTALLKQPHRKLASSVAIASMVLSCVASCCTLGDLLSRPSAQRVLVSNFNWFELADGQFRLGLLLDPLAALMLVMVSFVGLLIFIYSHGYMAKDPNYTRFFCFLSLFAAAMLGLVIANSLLLLFVCWEIMGLTSFLLIGFWYQKPSAVAAAKKAFITTRIGDLAFLLGMVWLYGETGTLLFYDAGAGCIESSQLATLVAKGTTLGMTVSTGVSLLLFVGAMGKSGQVPLHTWLPDAMEGPTPVSALIHAATMVAAGVFLIARVYPLAAVTPETGVISTTLICVAWVGAITAVFAASIAVAQTDIKRILAYSTVSQLGYMMLGLATGGVAAGMFHLLTHGFFKALLFLGAGSVIHGCHEEQDIRAMGGLRTRMPVTFATYAVGMLALSGFPLLFSGFWSKDAVLHAAHGWSISSVPFYLALGGAFLTAFYMTRQMVYVFLGKSRIPKVRTSNPHTDHHSREPHESPRVMTLPLVALAVCSIFLGWLGTPGWAWLQSFIENRPLQSHGFSGFTQHGILSLMAVSAIVAVIGLWSAYLFYSKRISQAAFHRSSHLPAHDGDPLRTLRPDIYYLLERRYFIDELYNASFVRLQHLWSKGCAWLDDYLFSIALRGVELFALGAAWLARLMDELLVNRGFDESCKGLSRSARCLSAVQSGHVQRYLRVLAAAAFVVAILLLWGCGKR